MSDSPATRPSQITVEALREIVSGFLLEAGKASGLSPQRFRYDLCERYGISDDTAKNWICGADHPEDHNLLNLFADYLELANRVLTTFGIADWVERAGWASDDRGVPTPQLTTANNSAAEAGDDLSRLRTSMAEGYREMWERLRLGESGSALNPPDNLSAVIEDLEQGLVPALEDALRKFCTTIAGSFPAGQPGTPEVYVGDMMKALREFPLDILEAAMREVRRTMERQPSVAEFYAIADVLRHRRQGQLMCAYWIRGKHKRRAPGSIEASVQQAHGLLADEGVERATGKSAALVREWGDPDLDDHRISLEQAVDLDVACSLHGGGAPLLEAHRRLVDEAERAGGAPQDRDVLTPRFTAATSGATDAGDDLSCSPTPLADGYPEVWEGMRFGRSGSALIPLDELPAVIDELERALVPAAGAVARNCASLIVRSFPNDAPYNDEAYASDMARELSEFPTDNLEATVSEVRRTFDRLPYIAEVYAIAKEKRGRRRGLLACARWMQEEHQRRAEQAERDRSVAELRPTLEYWLAVAKAIGGFIQSLGHQDDPPALGTPTEGLHQAERPEGPNIILPGRGEQLPPAAKERPGAKSGPQPAAPNPGTSIPNGWSQKRFEKVSRWRDRRDCLIADPKSEVTTQEAAAVKIGKMEVPRAKPSYVTRAIFELEQHLRAAPLDRNDQQK